MGILLYIIIGALVFRAIWNGIIHFFHELGKAINGLDVEE